MFAKGETIVRSRSTVLAELSHAVTLADHIRDIHHPDYARIHRRINKLLDELEALE